MEKKNTTLGKSGGVQDDKKLCADNITPHNILNKPSPIKVYSYNEFERSGRLSRNRTRDLKAKCYFFTLDFFCLLDFFGAVAVSQQENLRAI